MNGSNDKSFDWATFFAIGAGAALGTYLVGIINDAFFDDAEGADFKLGLPGVRCGSSDSSGQLIELKEIA